MEHPRWGLISSVVASKDIKAGEELYTNYGYRKAAEFPADFPWYWELKRNIEKEERLEAKSKPRTEEKKIYIK